MYHKWPIQLCLVLDDFAIKYVGRENAEHLQCILEEHYEITTRGGIKICWTQIGLRLQQERSPPLNAEEQA